MRWFCGRSFLAKLEASEEEESDSFLPMSLVIHESVEDESLELIPGTTRGILCFSFEYDCTVYSDRREESAGWVGYLCRGESRL